MIRQCGVCKIIMGQKPPLSDTSITHGICYKCSIQQLRKAGIRITKELKATLKKAS